MIGTEFGRERRRMARRIRQTVALRRLARTARPDPAPPASPQDPRDHELEVMIDADF